MGKNNSYGIACFRFNPNKKRYELLMVKKKYTYAYARLINSNLNITNLSLISTLLNNVNNYEKSLLLSYDFGKIWYHLYNVDPDLQLCEEYMSQRYREMKSRFMKMINFIGREIMTKLIINSYYSDSEWEIPKGRKELREGKINCAIREFAEETGIYHNRYDIIDPIYESYKRVIIKNKIEYNMHYYTAYIPYEECHLLRPNQVNYTEIMDIAFMDINEIRFVDKTKDKLLYKFCKIMFNKIKRELDYNTMMLSK